MKKHPLIRRSAPLLSGLLAGLLVALPALAQPADLQQRYRQDMANCKQAPRSQDSAACQREAAAALAAAKRGDLEDGPAAYARNAHERCMALPAPERYECVGRMRSPATGSVAGGGLLREGVTVTPPAGPPTK
ncbi:hypothetical protein [Roseateles sp.]|uniref:hypothetical protein n=1 Tax=Roseateles sp. TaxID=1971397 RepID=UPI00286BACC2|nr:hypothetical protein [Roseateles sp.]